MKIVDGKIELAPEDVRVGNLVFTPDGDDTVMSTISGVLSVRLSSHIASGTMLRIMVGDGVEAALTNYGTVVYNFLSTVPDGQFLAEVTEACWRCVERHMDVYGIKGDISKEEDDAVLEQERKFTQAKEEIAEGLERMRSDLEKEKGGETED